MKLLQITGPFKANTLIDFKDFIPRSYFRYIKIGVQAPQVPPLSEPENFPSGMIRVYYNSKQRSHCINANDILEFQNLYWKALPSIGFLQDMDAYTIIDIGYIDEQEDN